MKVANIININSLKDKFLSNISIGEEYKTKETKAQDYNRSFVENIQTAKTEWEQARNYFSSVSDPDLVDYALYKMQASEAFYTYLIKRAKKEKIHIEI